jgi:hypothetical protein
MRLSEGVGSTWGHGLRLRDGGGARAYGVGVRPRYRFAAIALGCGVAFAASAWLGAQPAGVPDAPPAVLVAVSHDGGARWLVRVAPVSLRPLPGRRLRLEAPLEAWALSPDNRLLAGVGDRARVLRLIDVERMRALGGCARWRAAGRRPWYGRGPAACGSCWRGRAAAVSARPLSWRSTRSPGGVVARRRLAGGLVRVAASPDGPVLVLAPPAVIGPARLVTVEIASAVAQLPLDGVSAGVTPSEGMPSVDRVRAPALAVDAGRRRAYVVSSRPYALKIDLRRGHVSGHRLVPQESLVDRLRELLLARIRRHDHRSPVSSS